MIADGISFVGLASIVLLGGSLVGSLVAVRRFAAVRDLFGPLDERFVAGLPWGTLAVALGLVGVYVGFQGGLGDGGPVVVGFRSWSFRYPQGLVLSPFAHLSDSHLVGNLVWAVAFGSIVEYVWGHYPADEPRERVGWRPVDVLPAVGSTPPRRVGLFVLGVVGYGIFGSLVVPGATIGFSGVVFALVGVALVVAPRAAVVGVLVVSPLRLVIDAVLDPVATATAGPKFVTPPWVDVSIQGHMVGLLTGVLAGLVWIRVRPTRQPAVRDVWFAALVVAAAQSLYAFTIQAGPNQYVMFRAAGTAAVFVLVTLVALATVRADVMLVDRIELWLREATVGLLLASLLAFVVVGVPYNLVSVTGDGLDGGITVEDYTVGYSEGVENEYATAVASPLASNGSSANVSGVVVTSRQRSAWHVAAPSSELEARGRVTVPVGDATWRETVTVTRRSWSVAGNDSAYSVTAAYDGTAATLFRSGPVRSPNTVDGKTISIDPTRSGFGIAVRAQNGTRYTTAVPARNASVTAGGIRFTRYHDRLFAVDGGTRALVGAYRGPGPDARYSSD